MNPLRTLLVAGVFGAGAIAGAVALTPAGADNTASSDSSVTARPAADHGPGHGFAQLTDTQRDCLKDAGLTRPDTRPSGPPTQEQIQKFRDTAKACGIELPAHPDHMGPGGPGGPGNPDSPSGAATSQ